jgi:diadenosine tetraphosphate (Ap4A) HIT family hydrolase
MECPFCPPALDNAQVILENAHCRFLQQPEPILIGSGIVVPKQHRATVFDLTREEWQSTRTLLHRVKSFLNERYAPDGYNIGWNCGAVGGQEIFHAHLHIIPRFKDEPFAGRGIRYWLRQETNRRVCTSKGNVPKRLPGESGLQVQIIVEGQIDRDWTEWLDGFSITHTAENCTLLTGSLPDQPALYGLLARLRDLGLPLVSMNSAPVET